MNGASLSRWTMSYFVMAFLALITAEILMTAGYGFPSHPVESPETLVLVHLVALGWLSLLLCGALFQFVPVLVSRPLFYVDLPLVALIFLIAGLGLLLVGFLGMTGAAMGRLSFLPLGGLSLAAGFSLVVWILGRTMWAAGSIGLPARFVVAGLASLAGVVSLGVIFTFVFSGWTAQPRLVLILAKGVPVHAAAGIGGWLTLTAIGVSYRLLAMFMLSPEKEHVTSRLALIFGAFGVVACLGGGLTCILLGLEPNRPLLLALAGAGGTLIFYGFDLVRLYRERKRRKVELNTRMALWALTALAIGFISTLVLVATGEIGKHIGALVFLIAFGWLSGLALAKLYKIVAFLTWLECYGPVLGKRPTPRVQDLVNEPRAQPWFYLYFCAVGAASIAAFFDAPVIFRLAAAFMLVATVKIGFELVHIRKLKTVAANLLPPDGMPRLFLTAP